VLNADTREQDGQAGVLADFADRNPIRGALARCRRNARQIRHRPLIRRELNATRWFPTGNSI